MEKVLRRYRTGFEYVMFSEGESVPHQSSIDFSLLDWQEMGYPEVITVTVVPGDQLNV